MYQISLFAHLSPGQILVGVATPNPPFAAYAAEKSPTNIFWIFQKQFRFTPCFSPISERTNRSKPGYAVLPFVFPACGVDAWHERQRTFIVAADVSHAPCLRQGDKQGRGQPGCVSVRQWDFPQAEQERDDLEPVPVSSGVLPDSGSVGGLPFHLEANGISEPISVLQPVSNVHR